jgi:phosphoserine phosphatase
MVQIVLIRPGATEYDLQGRIQGTLDIPLSDQGRDEVRLTANQIKNRSIAALYSAPGNAATESAHILADALGIKSKTVEALRNLNQGLWQGMLVDEVKQKQPKVYRQWQEQPENVCPPDGEMISEAQERVDDSLDRLLKKHRSGAIGIVVPEPLASIVVHRLTGGELAELWKPRNGCDCQEFDVNATMWRPEVSMAAAARAPDGNGK